MLKSVYHYAVLFLVLYGLLNTAQSAQLDVTGYSSIVGSYIKAENDNTYNNDFAHKYVNFTHRSRVGIQMNSKINDNFEFNLSLLMHGNSDYITHTDWFYASYHANEDVSIRIGRLKIPFFMISNYIDVGHAYPWVTPPQEVYSTNKISSVDGIEFIYETNLFDSLFLFNVYSGSSKNEIILSPAYINDPSENIGGKPRTGDPTFELGDNVYFDSNNLFGSEISITNDILTFRLGYYTSLIDSKTFSISAARTTISSVGLIVDWNSIVLYSEYINRYSDSEANILFADQTASYITLGYRFSNLLPYITFANIAKGQTDNPQSIIQNSITTGLRYELNLTTDIKFEITQASPNMEQGDIGRFGLLDKAVTEGEKPLIYSMSLDVLF